jgi:hypothetical protein
MGICGSAKKAPSKKRYDGEMAISNEANFITNEQKNNNNNNNLNFQSQNQVQVEFNNK